MITKPLMDEYTSADKYSPKDETTTVFPSCLDYTSENDKYEGPFNCRIAYDDNDSSTLTDEEFEPTTTDELSSDSFNDAKETKQPPVRLKRLFKYPVLARRRKGRQYIKKLIRAEMIRFQENIIKTIKKYQNMGRLNIINKCVKPNKKPIGNKHIENWSLDKKLTCPIHSNAFISRRKVKNIPKYLIGRQSTNVHFVYHKTKGVNLSTPAKHNLAPLRCAARESRMDNVIHEIRLATKLTKMNKQSINILQSFRPFSDMMNIKQIDTQTEVARNIDFKSAKARKLYFQSGVERHMNFQSEIVKQINSQTGVSWQIDFQTKEVKRLNFQIRVEHTNFQTGVVRRMYFQSEAVMQMDFVTGVVSQIDFQTGLSRQIDFQTGVTYQMHVEAEVMCLINSRSRAVRKLIFQSRLEQIEFNTGVVRQMYSQSEVTIHMDYETVFSQMNFKAGVANQMYFLIYLHTGLGSQIDSQSSVVRQMDFQTGSAKQMHFHAGIVSLLDFRSGAVRLLHFLTTVEQIDFQQE